MPQQIKVNLADKREKTTLKWEDIPIGEFHLRVMADQVFYNVKISSDSVFNFQYFNVITLTSLNKQHYEAYKVNSVKLDITVS